MPRTVVIQQMQAGQYKKAAGKCLRPLEVLDKNMLVTLHATGFSKIAKEIPQIKGIAKRKVGVQCCAHEVFL